ncbi:MAG: bifunctional phosphopantothenoylcysteine decarboxylase/phosphopantothenate--cysteine ligase CoaBC [Rhodospirillales bacterium]|nr:bifunctional phosphopantothenoylcysteine decarboxylase/phosphopantothenate--cysteine ligase CoaBC [Rhodospirillales bacterium]
MFGYNRVVKGKRLLLIVSGGIAAYKCLEVIRRLRDQGIAVRPILTRAGAQFVTPLSLGAISGDKVYQELFSLTDEHEIGHIRLARDADLVLVAPATANILAKMAQGIADDLASTVLLATDLPVMVAPAMNPLMWSHAATQANMRILRERGIGVIEPGEGEMAESNERGIGRLAEPEDIIGTVTGFLGGGRLKGRRALVTSGPTHEDIDPVRYIGNHSSGKQGHAIAGALARLGAETTLVTGPVQLPDPAGVTTVHVRSAQEMLAACEQGLPADVAVCAAAVADWRVAERAAEKIKKDGTGQPPSFRFTENPDILKSLSAPGNRRPGLIIGFAAETQTVIENAVSKRRAKGCDWIVANDVSAGSGTFGGDTNIVHLIRGEGETDIEHWPRLSKADVARRLGDEIAAALETAS